MGTTEPEILQLLAAWLLLTGPGIILVYSLFSTRGPAAVLLMGSLLGVGLVTWPSFLFYHVDITWFPVLLACLYAGAFWQLFRGWKGHRFPEVRFDWKLTALLLAVFASRLAPLFYSRLPLGTDPAFHLLIAKKILVTGRLPVDWTPFEPIHLNYPVGSHFFIALWAQFSGVPVYEAFKMCFPVFGVLSAGMVYLIAKQTLGAKGGALWAAGTYALLANAGSLDYYRWGGVPSLMGMLFCMGVIWLLFDENSRRAEILSAFVLVCAMIIHNHSGLCILIILAFQAGMALLVERRLTGISLSCVKTLVFSIPIGANVIWKYATDFAWHGGETSLFKFYEPLIGLDKGGLLFGIEFALVSLLGLVLMLRALDSGKKAFICGWFLSMFGSYVLFEFIYRFAAYARNGEFYSALTPSRFLTNAVYPMAVFSGLAIMRIEELIKPRFLRGLFRGACIVGIAVFATSRIRQDCGSDSMPALLAWVSSHTPQDALIMNNERYMPAICWREGSDTRLPSSEARNDPRVTFKRTWKHLDREQLGSWLDSLHRPVYFVSGFRLEKDPRMKLVYEHDGIRIYQWIAANAL